MIAVMFCKGRCIGWHPCRDTGEYEAYCQGAFALATEAGVCDSTRIYNLGVPADVDLMVALEPERAVAEMYKEIKP